MSPTKAPSNEEVLLARITRLEERTDVIARVLRWFLAQPFNHAISHEEAKTIQEMKDSL